MFISSVSIAQNVTTFMGVEIDGTETEFVNKLESKGFVSVSNGIAGKFNGRNVVGSVVTNYNQVYRVGIIYFTDRDEIDVIHAYNQLMRQFNSNNKYTKTRGNSFIDSDVNLSYEIKINNNTFTAEYYQNGNKQSPVWFTIRKDYGMYYIYLIYENLYNAPNGEDL